MEDKILIAVSKANLQTIKKYLEPLDLSQYDILSSMKFLNKILDIIRKRQPNGRTKTLDVILEKWHHPDDADMDLLISELGSIILISQDNLNYIIETYGDILPEEVLSFNIHNDSKDKAFSFGFLCSRIITAWKGKEIMMQDGWVRLLKAAEERNRRDAVSYILKLISKKTSYAEIPSWMKKKAEKVSSIIEDPKNTKEVVSDFIVSSSNSSPLNDKFRETLNTFSHLELSSIVSCLSGDDSKKIDDPDMVEGPLNPIVQDDDTIRECLGSMSYRNNKGCRMLTCICIVNSDEDYDLDEIPKMSWFDGKCEECHKKIKLACHSIRLPLDHGGWVGCFCSEDCAIDTANREIKENLAANVKGLERYKQFNNISAIVRFKGIVEHQDNFYLDEDTPSSEGQKVNDTVLETIKKEKEPNNLGTLYEEEKEPKCRHFDIETYSYGNRELPEEIVSDKVVGIETTVEKQEASSDLCEEQIETSYDFEEETQMKVFEQLVMKTMGLI